MVTREQMVTQSVEDFVEASLHGGGYADIVDVRDAFPTLEERATEMTKTVLAFGFNFDDGGREIELGSNLTMRVYTIEVWVFGLNPTEGENVATVVRSMVEAAATIPLKDVGSAGAPVIDQLELPEGRAATVQRQISSDPRVWDRFVWTVTLKVEDTYYPVAP